MKRKAKYRKFRTKHGRYAAVRDGVAHPSSVNARAKIQMYISPSAEGAGGARGRAGIFLQVIKAVKVGMFIAD